jgi:hypothetical protein
MQAYFSLRDYSENDDMYKVTSSSPFDGNADNANLNEEPE